MKRQGCSAILIPYDIQISTKGVCIDCFSFYRPTNSSQGCRVLFPSLKFPMLIYTKCVLNSLWYWCIVVAEITSGEFRWLAKLNNANTISDLLSKRSCSANSVWYSIALIFFWVVLMCPSSLRWKLTHENFQSHLCYLHTFFIKQLHRMKASFMYV